MAEVSLCECIGLRRGCVEGLGVVGEGVLVYC